MNLRLKALGLLTLSSQKRRLLAELFYLTAEAFQTDPPSIDNLSHNKLLREYATFTEKEATKILRSGRARDEVEGRLFSRAFELGGKLRRDLRLRTDAEVMAAARHLYRLIGIDFRGNCQGEVTIKRCSFSTLYSPETCFIMSSLDKGILAGLSGGGKLYFFRRITEGGDCCKARLVLEEKER